MRSLSGLLFVVGVGSVAGYAAMVSYGTMLEKLFSILTIVAAVITIIGLYGIWRNINVFTSRELRAFAWFLPLVAIAQTLNFYIIYADQKPWQEMLGGDLVGIVGSIVVSLLFWGESKNEYK